MHSQYHQAPLYYMLLAPLARALPDSSGGFALPFNPNQQLSVVGNDNSTIFAHSRSEAFPYTGSPTALAVHVLRLISVFLGTVSLLGTYTLGQLLWPERRDRHLAMTALAAFWPVVLGLNGAINNDMLLFPLSVWTVVQALRFRSTPSARSAILLGALLGAALLAKVSAVILIAPIGVVLMSDRRLWRHIPFFAAATLVVCGWWYAHLTITYGDPLATRAIAQTWPDDTLVTDAPRLAYAISMTHTQAYSRLWARFGHGAIAVDSWLYTAFDIALFMAWVGGIAGAFQAIRRRKFDPAVLAVISWVAANYLLIVYFSATRTYGAQGRYMLISVPAIAALMTFGYDTLLRRVPVWPKTITLVAVPAVTAAFLLFSYFIPAYRVLEVPADIPRPLDIRYGDAATLIGMSPAALAASAGETLTIELYWRALAPSPITLQTFLHGVESEAFLWRDSLPGNGHRRADDWITGETWAERYIFHIPENIAPGTEIPLAAGLFDLAGNQDLPAYFNGSTTPDHSIIGILTITE